jgi:hypothetical protein
MQMPKDNVLIAIVVVLGIVAFYLHKTKTEAQVPPPGQWQQQGWDSPNYQPPQGPYPQGPYQPPQQPLVAPPPKTPPLQVQPSRPNVPPQQPDNHRFRRFNEQPNWIR